jgi:hypothetical protein
LQLNQIGLWPGKMILGMLVMCFNLALAAEQLTLPIAEQKRSSELSLPVVA